MPYLLEMRPKELKQAVSEKAVLLVPVGTVEYHGSALPFGTDLLIVKGLIRKIEKCRNVIVAPDITFSPNGYMVSGPEQGTIDISIDCFIQYCGELFSAYSRMGFSKIVFICHHQAKNISTFIKTAVLKFGVYNSFHDLGTGWWTAKKTSDTPMGYIEVATLGTGYFSGHGGKGESEAILALYPELFDKTTLTDEEPFWNISAVEADESQARHNLSDLVNQWIEKLDML